MLSIQKKKIHVEQSKYLGQCGSSILQCSIGPWIIFYLPFLEKSFFTSLSAIASMVLDENQSMEEKQRSVLKYEILKTYDSLAETKTGALSSKLISVDPLTRSFNVTNFDYSK